MPRPCTICQHDDRELIELALATGEPAARVAAKHRVSADAVSRHFASHVRPGVARVQALVRDRILQEERHAIDVLAEVERLHQRAVQLLEQAEAANDLRTALSGIRETRGCLELLAKLRGQLDDRPQVSILISPEWLQVRSELLVALHPYPDAKAAVAARLVALDAA